MMLITIEWSGSIKAQRFRGRIKKGEQEFFLKRPYTDEIMHKIRSSAFFTLLPRV